MKQSNTFRLVAVLWAFWACFCPSNVYAGWKLEVRFTTSSPRGDLKYEPRHVHAVWVENAAGAFVKTIGRWGVVEHSNLTQWMAADGTHLDGWTGATPMAYQSHTTVWDLTDRSDAEVPDGRYRLRFELTNRNAEKGQYHRSSVLFDKNGVERSQAYGSPNGYTNISVNYFYEPTVLAQLSTKPARYITRDSARVFGHITDTGGENPRVTLYWGQYDGATNPGAWDYQVVLGTLPEGRFYRDLKALDPDTPYTYRYVAHNAAGQQWSEATQTFTTHGPTGFYQGYRVQSGRVEVTGASRDVDIMDVSDMRRAFALISYGTGWQPDTENANTVLVRGALVANDTLRIERATSVNSTWVSWQVIECLDAAFTVYRASGSFNASQTNVEVPLGGPKTRRSVSNDISVDPDYCLAYVTADTDSASRDFYHRALLTAQVNSATSIRIQRGSSGDHVTYNWVVVEFDPMKVGSVQQGSVNFRTASNGSPARATIRPVNPASSILIYQSRTSTNGLAYSAIAGRLASSNTVEFYQHQGDVGTRNAEFHVIDFGARARAQRGQIDLSEDTAWIQAEIRLSDIGQALVIAQSRAYVAVGSAGFEIVDLTHPVQPVSLSVTHTGNVVRDVAIIDSQLYVEDRLHGPQIYDVTDPNAPMAISN
jgi:hypothetical protein